MMRPNDGDPNLETIHAASFPTVLLLMAAVSLGALAAAVILPAALPGLAASLLGPEPKAYWYLARSSAWVAYVLFWLTVTLGLLLSTKAARIWPGGPAAADIHQFISLLALAFALFHGLILTGDRYIGFSAAQVLIPFSNPAYRPFWVGLGQIGFYLAATVILSFYLRKRIGPQIWRKLHILSFFMFAAVMLHGIMSGTDTAQPLATAAYWVTGGSVAFLTLFRYLTRPVKTPVRTAATEPAPWRKKASLF